MAVTDSAGLSRAHPPRVQYLQRAAKYVTVMLPAPVDDTEDGQPEDDSEMFSEAASYSEVYVPSSPLPATQAAQSHQPDLGVGETEVSFSDTVGIWSIAGRT